MPQLILDYSSNITENENLEDLLKTINEFLSKTLPTELSSCKSRAIKTDTFCVGNGDEKNAFIHANLKVMPGRSVEKLNNVGNGVLKIIKEYFCQTINQLNLQITVEICELEKNLF